MSTNWYKDILDMHEFYGMTPQFSKMDPEKLKAHLKFRTDFLKEEYEELTDEGRTAEDVVDALIDLIVVAIGTLDAFTIDGQKAWDAVLAANMSKKPGVNASRPNAFGLPDLIKPEGWTAPSHEGNHGLLTKVFDAKPAYGPCEI